MQKVFRNHNIKPTVLIVDDNPTNLSVLLDYLIVHNFRVLVAEDGESALARARFAGPDIILLDVMMPKMDGFEVCRRLKDEASTREIPVIFMTALSGLDDKVKSFQAGAVDYVTKPFHQEEVLARLNTHCRLRELRSALEARNEQLEQEVAQRKRSEVALQRYVAELKARNAELDTFTRAVAHDLTNELHQILGGTQLLAMDLDGGSEQCDLVQLISDSGHRMNETFRELLLLAQLRDGTAVMGPVDMSAVIARGRKRLRSMIVEYAAEIVEPGAWPSVIGYGPWIEQVWINYLSNAMKYGGRPPRITVGATRRDTGTIRCWVRDNGTGISDEACAHLFSNTIRLDQSRVEGFGLGLSVVHHIVAKQGGRVGVESEPGRGSTFYFELPAAE